MGIGVREPVVGLTKEYGDTHIVFRSNAWKLYVDTGGKPMFDTNPFYAAAEYNSYCGEWAISRNAELVAWAPTREDAVQTLEGLCALEGYV